MRRRIAPAAVAQQQDGRGVRIAAAANAVPVPPEAVAGELAGVGAQGDVDVAAVAGKVVDAVGNDHTGGPTREVVVERLKCLLCVNPPRAKELPEMFLCLGIDGEHGG